MKTVYLFLADGFETIEALTVVDMLRRAKVSVKTVSIYDHKKVVSSHKVPVEADCTFGECDFSDAAMLVLPGGIPGTPNLEAHEGLRKLIEEKAATKDCKLAAICAAPSIYGNMGLLNGKKATAYPGFEDKLTGAQVMDAKVVVDGDFITARGMGVTIEFAATILKELGYDDMAEKVINDIQFKQFYM